MQVVIIKGKSEVLILEITSLTYVIFLSLEPSLVPSFKPTAFQIQTIVDLVLVSRGVTSFTSVSFLPDFSKP